MNRKVLLVGLLLVAPLLVMLASGLRHDPREVISPLIGRPGELQKLVADMGVEVVEMTPGKTIG